MRRSVLIATAIVAAAAVCAGCASSNRAASAPSTVAGSGAGSIDPGTSSHPPAVSASPTAPTAPIGPPPTQPVQLPPGQPLPSVSGAPVPIPPIPPSGPAASAATATPPPAGGHAFAKVGAATVTCPAQAFAEAPPGHSASPLAAGLQVTAVVRCETVMRSYPGLGQWNVQLAEVADTGLAPFVAQLRLPSQQRPPDIMCPMYVRLSPWFALVDSAGAVLQPSMPTDQCGQIRGSAIEALNNLDFHVVDAVRTQEVTSP